MIEIRFIKRCDGWLSEHLKDGPLNLPVPEQEPLIETRSELTNQTGRHPLWEGYQSVPNYPRASNPFRRADQVRTTVKYGRFYSWLVEARKSSAVVEFGTAFGVSGMYWLAGLAKTGGTLFTFEPNTDWANLAKDNLDAIGARYLLTNGTFEENAEAVLSPGSVDIGFIDAIHTDDFVTSQMEILTKFMRPRGLILFDDINFSEDMKNCWSRISTSDIVSESATIASRVGIVELSNS